MDEQSANGAASQGLIEKFGARPVTLALCCIMAAGLFIWFKLRLVTGMPRSAYAVPEEVEPARPGEAPDKVVNAGETGAIPAR